MKNRLVLLLATVAPFVLLNLIVNWQAGALVPPTPPINTPDLFPESIGRFHRAEAWNTELDDSAREEAARYTGRGGEPAIDFSVIFDSRDEHNALACYISRGERLTHQWKQSIPTANVPAIFDLGVLVTPEGVRMVASTQCRTSGCTALKPGGWLGTMSAFASSSSDAPIPIAIVTSPVYVDKNQESAIPGIEAELGQFLKGIDGSLMQKLAKSQQHGNYTSQTSRNSPSKQ